MFSDEEREEDGNENENENSSGDEFQTAEEDNNNDEVDCQLVENPGSSNKSFTQSNLNIFAQDNSLSQPHHLSYDVVRVKKIGNRNNSKRARQNWQKQALGNNHLPHLQNMVHHVRDDTKLVEPSYGSLLSSTGISISSEKSSLPQISPPSSHHPTRLTGITPPNLASHSRTSSPSCSSFSQGNLTPFETPVLNLIPLVETHLSNMGRDGVNRQAQTKPEFSDEKDTRPTSVVHPSRRDHGKSEDTGSQKADLVNNSLIFPPSSSSSSSASSSSSSTTTSSKSSPSSLSSSNSPSSAENSPLGIVPNSKSELPSMYYPNQTGHMLEERFALNNYLGGENGDEDEEIVTSSLNVSPHDRPRACSLIRNTQKVLSRASISSSFSKSSSPFNHFKKNSLDNTHFNEPTGGEDWIPKCVNTKKNRLDRKLSQIFCFSEKQSPPAAPTRRISTPQSKVPDRTLPNGDQQQPDQVPEIAPTVADEQKSSIINWTQTLEEFDYKMVLEHYGIREIKRQQLIWELIQTEGSFIKSLKFLISKILKPIISNYQPIYRQEQLRSNIDENQNYRGDDSMNNPQLDFLLRSREFERLKPFKLIINFSSVLIDLIQNGFKVHERYIIKSAELIGSNLRINTADQLSVEASSEIDEQISDLTPNEHPDCEAINDLLSVTDRAIRNIEHSKSIEDDYKTLKSLETRLNKKNPVKQIGTSDQELVVNLNDRLPRTRTRIDSEEHKTEYSRLQIDELYQPQRLFNQDFLNLDPNSDTPQNESIVESTPKKLHSKSISNNFLSNLNLIKNHHSQHYPTKSPMIKLIILSDLILILKSPSKSRSMLAIPSKHLDSPNGFRKKKRSSTIHGLDKLFYGKNDDDYDSRLELMEGIGVSKVIEAQDISQRYLKVIISILVTRLKLQRPKNLEEGQDQSKVSTEKDEYKIGSELNSKIARDTKKIIVMIKKKNSNINNKTELDKKKIMNPIVYNQRLLVEQTY
ncbi:hypothetical protein BY996DRAFT_6584934 [Phakopsora pachyrhizi]|nr:hypothetical protein BY996DRAFT_6584934 [Phakopsora pachyrhizi]